VADQAPLITKLIEPLRVTPGARVTLGKDFDPRARPAFLRKKDGTRLLRQGVQLISEYQIRLAAQGTHGLLIVLQAPDAGGKDGTIRHVLSGVNPQGVRVHSFKVPSEEELHHDFLWRYSRQLPARGEIGVFNRSHYEEVLVVRVHPDNLDHQRLPPEAQAKGVWRRRFRDINDWERHLAASGFKIVKLMLNLSKEEQRARFLGRLDRPDKNWKFNEGDIDERRYWDDYQRAYSRMLSHTSTPWAPWYVIPADRKWFARTCASAIIAQALVDIGPRYPRLAGEAGRELDAARAALLAEAPGRTG
jgi:PPK2 family polyphosphate:nucleotide phosphotransferase